MRIKSKVKVRKVVFDLREFTTQDLIVLTKENPESIRTEIQRMRKNGLVVSEKRVKTAGKRGGPHVLYRITEKGRAELSREDFAKQKQHIAELLKEKIGAFLKGVSRGHMELLKASELIDSDADKKQVEMLLLDLIDEAVKQMKGGK